MSTYYKPTLSEKYDASETHEARTLKFPRHEITILGYMAKYKIPNEYYEPIYEFICQKIGDYLITNPHRPIDSNYILYDICENHLEKFRFEKDMLDVLEEKND